MTALMRLPATQTAMASALPGDAAFEHSSSGISPLQAALRHKWGIVFFAISVTVLASVILKHVPVRYAASASVMVDARKMQVIDAQSVLSAPMLDMDRLRTYMEQLNSPAVAQAVVEQLDLTHNPEYCAAAPSPWMIVDSEFARFLNRPVPTLTESSCSTSTENATEHLLQVVSGSNDGRSYIIRIGATANTPELASKISNAYARAFVASQRKQTSEATEQADTWLSTYLASLQTQMQTADSAVEQYQRRNQLTPVRGETIVAQRLTELNSQLTVAASALEEKQSALRQIQSVADNGGQVNASAPAVLASSVIQRLVEKQAELQANEADLRTRYGELYPAVQAVAAQRTKLRQTIEIEVNKVILSLRSEVAALTSRKAALTTAVQSLQSATGEQGTANVRLQELQRDADSEHHLYESMLTRLHQVDAERHMQWPDSTVAVEARPPQFPSFPRTKMILTGIFMVSLGVGAAIAFAVSLLARRFRDVEQVEAETGARVLGLFPQPPRRSSPKGMMLDEPASPESETVLFALANLISGRVSPHHSEGWVVMVTSSVPGEGKSSFAVALGQAAVRVGMSVALLECDVRSLATSSPRQAKAVSKSLDQPLSGSGDIVTKAGVDRSRLNIFPLRAFVPEAERLVASSKVESILRTLRSQYELIVIDTPPILAVPDALTMGPLVDDTVLVLDWRKTARRSVSATVRVLMRTNIAITGIVLSKVDLRQFARLTTSEGFYARAYKGYRVTLAR